MRKMKTVRAILLAVLVKLWLVEDVLTRSVLNSRMSAVDSNLIFFTVTHHPVKTISPG